MTQKTISKLLVANRSEIAIRIMRAARELGIEPVAIYSEEDRLTLHRFNANEAYCVGQGKKPIDAYLDIEDVLRIAKAAGCDAVHPGYGLLSENPDFAERCAEEGIIFVGPSPDVMRKLGNKVEARAIAQAANVPVMPASDPLPEAVEECEQIARTIGYPVMLKASWGGGGRGMRVIETAEDLFAQLPVARREAAAAFGNDEVYFEKLVRRARHVEVQIVGDQHGNLVHLYERDCSVQRRHQKVVERAPAPYLDATSREEICTAALRLAQSVDYANAGTVEFLMDVDSGEFYFIEVNPRVQVEHTVTEQITGLDIVKSQIRIAMGGRIGDESSGIPEQSSIEMRGSALQCRVTTEDPGNNFIPDYGHIVAYRSPAGPGIRLDAGTAYSGAVITRHYDSLLVKVTASGQSDAEAQDRMLRALSEFKIRGVETNLAFLQGLIAHENFVSGDYTTRFIDNTPALLDLVDDDTSGVQLLEYIADVIVNGNPMVSGRAMPNTRREPTPPTLAPADQVVDGVRQILDRDGPEAVAAHLKSLDYPLVTDTTFRDAHQSLLATRMRSIDMLRVAPHYAQQLPALFSVESWGGATFDVAMRFLCEDPWERLHELSTRMPNLMQQMLLRSANGVGYKNYPDNVVRFFIREAASAGVDVFRIFDCLNWVDNMRLAIDEVASSGKIAEAAICYTGDILDPNRSKYSLKYYVDMAKHLEAAGAHILGIKDMAGLLKPAAARQLVTALKNEIELPIHFHTHDTSGAAAASVIAAAEAGVDVFDAAMDSMSGLTSQPNLGSIVAALRHGPQDTGLDIDAIRSISDYWEDVRGHYAAFESDVRAGASEVYLHEMPGGQFTNLKEQAASLGIGRRWHEVARNYADVNMAFGDIVKVTPSSKVVGDMALMMTTSDVSIQDVLDPDVDIAFPESVVALFAGELGQPPGGFPTELQHKVLKGREAMTERPGESLPAADLEAERAEGAGDSGVLSDQELASYLMYPKVFNDYREIRARYGDVSTLPTAVFLYGMEPEEEISLEMADGRSVIIKYLTVTEADEQGFKRAFFEINGQPSSIRVLDRHLAPADVSHEKAQTDNPAHVAAPMPGLVVTVAAELGQNVSRGDPLVTIEAMKMETVISAEADGVVERVAATVGMQVEAKDLLVVVNPALPD